MKLPHRSTLGNLIRFVATGVLVRIANLSEPVRSKIRGRELARASDISSSRDADRSGPPVLVLMVYRARNVATVQILLRQLGTHAEVRLWALDEVAPELASNTLGFGPGPRFVHLNWLYGARPVAEDSWLVVADDDVFFFGGGLTTMVALMGRGGFSLAQPGHSMLRDGGPVS